MNKYENYLLISDLDGTLISTKQDVSEENINAINDFVAHGGTFAIATGRNLSNIGNYVSKINVNGPSIFHNGCMLANYKTHEVYKLKPLEKSGVWDYLKLSIEKYPTLCLQIYTDDVMYVASNPENEDVYLKREKVLYEYSLLDDLKDKLFIKVIFHDTEEVLNAIDNEIFSYISKGNYHTVFSSSFYLELTAKHATKGDMIPDIRNHPDYKGKTIVVCGDYLNDYEMFLTADVSVAPANAHPKIKEVATHIVRDNDHHLLEGAITEVIDKMIEKSNNA